MTSAANYKRINTSIVTTVAILQHDKRDTPQLGPETTTTSMTNTAT